MTELHPLRNEDPKATDAQGSSDKDTAIKNILETAPASTVAEAPTPPTATDAATPVAPTATTPAAPAPKAAQEPQAAQEASPKPTSIWNRSFIVCCLAAIFQNLGLQMSHGILSKYTESLGGDAVVVGLITGLFAITALGFKVLSGPTIDSFDHKKILTIFMLVLGAAFFGCSLSSSVVGVGAAMLLRGFAQAFVGTVSLVMVAVYLPKDQLGKGIAYFGVAQAVCQAMGPSLSLTLSVYIGYKATYAIAGALEVIGAFVVLLIKEPSRGTKPFRISLSSVFTKKALIPMILIALLNLPFASIPAFLVIDAVSKGVPQEQIGLFFTVFAITTIIMRPIFGGLSDKIGVKKTVIPLTVIFAISFALLPHVDSLIGYLAVAVINACGFGVSFPVIQALAMKMVSQDEFTAASNSCYIGNDIGCFAGPLIAGWLVSLFGCSTMWYIMIAPCLLVIAILLLVRLPKGV